MSTTTSSDEKRYEAKELIEKAYKLLIDAVWKDTYGSGDLSDEYKETIEVMCVELIWCYTAKRTVVLLRKSCK